MIFDEFLSYCQNKDFSGDNLVGSRVDQGWLSLIVAQFIEITQ